MKKRITLLVIAGLFFASCQKFEEAVDNKQQNDAIVPSDPSTVTSMEDLTISDSFDWKMTKTLDVEITLPENDFSRILYILSEDGKKLYFKGHPSDGSNILKTKITVPTYENGLQLKYGLGEDYKAKTTYIGSNTVVYDINSSIYKDGENDDDDCGGCDGKMTSLSLQYNGNGVNTVEVYTKRKKHKLTTEVGVSNGTTFTFSTEFLDKGKTKQTTEIEIYVNESLNTKIHTSCSQPIYVGMTSGDFTITAGTSKNGGDLLECSENGDDDVEFGCLTMWALDDNNPGNLYYIKIDEDPVSVYTEGDIEGLQDAEDMESLAIDDNGDLYFINVKNSSKLYKIPYSELDKDENTAVNATYIGNTGITGNNNKITNLTFIDGDLYGIGVRSEKVYRIDKTDGSVTQVATLNQQFYTSGLTIGTDDVVYLLYTNNTGGESELWKFNSFPSGDIVKVMDIEGSLKVESLAAHPNGFLYAADDYKFFKLDPVNLTTEVLVEYESDIEGIDFHWDKELSCVDDDDGEYCDDNSSDDVATFKGYKFELVQMTENNDGTSTWKYEVTGEEADHKLKKWILELCQSEDQLISANHNGQIADYLNIHGVKWEKEIDLNEGPVEFTFVLNGHYDIKPVKVAFYAGGNKEYECMIQGPDCDPNEDPDPDPEPEDFTGTLAYEDLWPGKGDYDINDLVIEYDFEVQKDNQEYIETIIASFKIRAFGAELHNGFGFTFPNVDASDIQSVSGYDIQATNVFNIAANGVESGQSKATFIVYDDAYRIMQHPGSGIGVNTYPPAPYVEPEIITLTIEFKSNSVKFADLDIGNFNPFIVVDQKRGMEVHLPNYAPTDLHDPAYFGTFADDSQPNINRYYLTKDNLPWGIHIPETFDYPVEKQLILGAYLHFAEWAQSNGVNYPDWYKDLPGYRNASVIY